MGAGPPVIVIPGSPRTDADYVALAAALAARYETARPHKAGLASVGLRAL